jgi:DNA-binding response OmpR family regulator
MLSFFSKKWKQAKNFIKTAALQAIKQSLMTKEGIEQPVCKILCVDDDRSFCQFMKRLSLSMGIQLDEAYSIEEGRRAIEAYPSYQAFIIDGHLPDGSGFQLVAWIREKKKLDTPIGFISRIYQDSKSFRILKEGLKVNYVLEKPINPSEVHQLLAQLCQIKSQPSGSEPFSDDLLADLKASYQKTISDKVERLETMILAVQKNPTIENLQALRGEVHKIAGSAGSYGYMAVSELCKNLELELIKQIDLAKRGQLDHQWLFTLDEFFTQVKLHFQIELLESDVEGALRARHLPSVYIVDEDQAFLSALTQPNQEMRFDILTESRPEKAIQTLLSADVYPQILFCDAHYQTSVLTGYHLIKAFYQSNDYLTTIIALIIKEQAVEEQVEALRKGMTCVFQKPLPMPFLLPLLDQTPFRPLPLPYKILVIDDDVDICQYILKILKYLGLKTTSVQDLTHIKELLADYKPDLILLDINLKTESGIGGLEQIRKQLGYNQLLIGMVTITQQDSQVIQKCYDAGVDEILFKPLEGGVIQRKVASLLRTKAQEQLSAKPDAMTGLESAQTLKHYLQRLHQHIQESLPISLVMFEIENFASLDQTRKNEVAIYIAQALEDLLKKYDLAAYLGDGRFALVFQGYESHFIQLFMRDFLLQVHAHLKMNLLTDKPFHMNECLIALSSERSINALLQEGGKQLSAAQKEPSKQPVNMRLGSSLAIKKEVWIFQDEGQTEDFIRPLFEGYDFKAALFAKIDEIPSSSLFPLPLIILTGSWATAKSLPLLKKLSLHNQVQIPTLYISREQKDDLQHLLSEVDYFNSPFGMVIILAT